MPDYKFLFHHLSSNACGDQDLNAELSDEYYDILASDQSIMPTLKTLLDNYDLILQANPSDVNTEVKKLILANAALKELLKRIIKIWYLGKPDLKELKGTKFFYYYEALIWKVVHAHPAGISGGYYGYWRYKPEN